MICRSGVIVIVITTTTLGDNALVRDRGTGGAKTHNKRQLYVTVT